MLMRLQRLAIALVNSLIAGSRSVRAIALKVGLVLLSISLLGVLTAPAYAQSVPPNSLQQPVLFKQDKDNAPPQPMSAAERTALNDPFFQRVLNQPKPATTLPEINKALNSSKQDVFVVDERIKDTNQKPGGSAAVRRAIVTPQGTGLDSQNVMFAVAFTPEQFPTENFIEVMGWDDSQGRFNYYKFDQSGGELTPSWKFRGSSQDADRLSVEARKNTCMQCHINGGPVMKELVLPWNHWHSFSDVIAYLEPGNSSWPIAKAANSPLRHLAGAETLETATIMPTITRFNERRINALKAANGQAITDARRILKPLFVTTEFNLISSNTLSPFHPFAPAPSNSSQTVNVPNSFFLNSALLQGLGIFPNFEFASLSGRDYAHLVQQTKTRLDGKQPGDANFAWFVPEASFMDTDFVKQLVDRNIVPQNFVAAALAVDLENPILSSDRAKLWNDKIIPAQFKIGAQNDLIPQVIQNLIALNPAQGTPEATFLQLLRSPNAVDVLRQRVDQYVNREQQRLDLRSGATAKTRSDEWIRLYKLSLQRREAILADATLKSLDETSGKLLFARGEGTVAVASLPSTVVSRPTLRRGAKGNEVIFLQQRLQVFGLLDGANDGDFGPATEAAVMAMQKQSNLTADGIVGPITWAILQELA